MSMQRKLLRLTEEQELSEVANLLNMDTKHVREMLSISKEMLSLDMEVSGKDSSTTTVGEMIEDTVFEQPEEKSISSAMTKDLNDVIDTLKPAEAKVLRMRYGLTGKKPMSLKEIGDEFSLTKERIRQIEIRALKRMQHPVRSRRLESYIA